MWQWLKKILVRVVLAFVLLTVVPVLALRWVPVPTSSFMVQRAVDNLLDSKKHPPIAYDWTPWERISPYAALAVMASEDQKFPEHDGFDFEAIEKAQRHNQTHRRKRGASTISQQVAKNLFLWPERSWFRKGLEVYVTLLIEMLWPKQRILEVYLNIAELGPNVYGVEAAARTFWKKPASKLTANEAAVLAAVLPNPKRMRAQNPSGYVLARAAWIQRQMGRIGLRAVRDIDRTDMNNER